MLGNDISGVVSLVRCRMKDKASGPPVRLLMRYFPTGVRTRAELLSCDASLVTLWVQKADMSEYRRTEMPKCRPGTENFADAVKTSPMHQSTHHPS
jgi:hypothetical protein